MRPLVALRNAVFVAVVLVSLVYYYAVDLSTVSALDQLQTTAQHRYVGSPIHV